ncbi:anthranilate phosphoribosyltransferase family protein [Allocoleopsis sp.]|uniref:anthranilate phosphoribosyltransferase family protein n=1 Tax=Allocoleopsis sp. TaxID=3088169 RepID=UPI002FCEADA6
MSNAFRELLKKVGSGVHTGEDLSREEAAIATRMMLTQEATPAQIGAFMIAHRIKRPTSAELAGMLDAYEQIGPMLQPWGSRNGGNISTKGAFSQPMMVFGTPYDGRSRTASVTPLTALILATAGVSVLMHGGECMPTKYGVPLIEIWQGLGVDLSKLTLVQVEQLLKTSGLGFIYLPQHFPEAQALVPYRDQIGKRPPFATMELIWSPYAGDFHMVAGYVHPPTEVRFRETLGMRKVTKFTLVKGLEGSCDLPRDRTAIIAISQPDSTEGFERILLHPRDYSFAAKEVPLDSTLELIEQMLNVLNGKSSELMSSAIWNGGFYLWRSGVCSDLPAGFTKAEELFTGGHALQKLQEIKGAIASMQLTHQS